MRVIEIYQSIQGESSKAGLACVFVRTAGCDLRCSWCDSEFSFTGGRQMSVEEILAEVSAYPAQMVELTGGEPLLQRDLPELALRLLERGYEVLCETGGHRDVSLLDPRVVKIVDIKCPSSGESGKVMWSNLNHCTERDELKFVIADRADYEWALEIIRERRLERFNLLLSPVHGRLEPKLLAEWMLVDGLRARLQLQLHKYIWGANARGV